jgi:hypothetical protein
LPAFLRAKGFCFVGAGLAGDLEPGLRQAVPARHGNFETSLHCAGRVGPVFRLRPQCLEPEASGSG